MQHLDYVVQRAVHCLAMQDALRTSALVRENSNDLEEYAVRHYHTTIHALGALGMTGYEIDVTLREAEAKWNCVRDQGMDIPWPYPSRLKPNDKRRCADGL